MKDLVLAVKQKDREAVNRFAKKNEIEIQDFKDVLVGHRHIFVVMAGLGWVEELSLFLKTPKEELERIGVFTDVAIALRESELPIQKIFDFSPDLLLKEKESWMRWWWKMGWGKPSNLEKLKESLLFIENNQTGSGKEEEKDVAVEFALKKAKGKNRPLFVQWMKEEGVFERYKVEWVSSFPKESLEFARECEVEKCFEGDFFLTTLAQQTPTKDWLSLMEFLYIKSSMKKEIKKRTEEIIHGVLLRNLPKERINHLAKFIKTNQMGFNKADVERWSTIASLFGNMQAVWSWSKEFDIDLSAKVGLMDKKLGLAAPGMGSLWHHLTNKLSEKDVGAWLQKTDLNELEWVNLFKEFCLNEENPEKWLPKLLDWGFKMGTEMYVKEGVEVFARMNPTIEQWMHGELLKNKFGQEKPKLSKRAL